LIEKRKGENQGQKERRDARESHLTTFRPHRSTRREEPEHYSLPEAKRVIEGYAKSHEGVDHHECHVDEQANEEAPADASEVVAP
jgi:hypothetical protein